MEESRQRRIEGKLARLTELVNEYLPYLTRWDGVEVQYDRFTFWVSVTWFRKAFIEGYTTTEWQPFDRRSFGIEDLDDRIRSYESKIKYQKSKGTGEQVQEGK